MRQIVLTALLLLLLTIMVPWSAAAQECGERVNPGDPITAAGMNRMIDCLNWMMDNWPVVDAPVSRSYSISDVTRVINRITGKDTVQFQWTAHTVPDGFSLLVVLHEDVSVPSVPSVPGVSCGSVSWPSFITGTSTRVTVGCDYDGAWTAASIYPQHSANCQGCGIYRLPPAADDLPATREGSVSYSDRGGAGRHYLQLYRPDNPPGSRSFGWRMYGETWYVGDVNVFDDGGLYVRLFNFTNGRQIYRRAPNDLTITFGQAGTGSRTFRFADADYQDRDHSHQWHDSGLDWNVGDRLTVTFDR